jgi:hypothetical protein
LTFLKRNHSIKSPKIMEGEEQNRNLNTPVNVLVR